MVRPYGALLIIAAAAVLRGGVHGIFHTEFKDKGSALSLSAGSLEYIEQGLRLEGDSRIRLAIPHGSRVKNGIITLTFTPPEMDKRLLPVLASPGDCHCAIKLRTGLGEVELSDRWIRIRHFRKNLTEIDTVLAQHDVEMAGGPGETLLSMFVLDDALRVSVNGGVMVTTPFFLKDFGDIGIATYKKSFLLHAFSIDSFQRDTLKIDVPNRTVEAAARFHPDRFNRTSGLRNHHFIVWEKGRAAPHALFTTYAPDSSIHDALLSIGARPGNNLTLDSWNRRKSSRSGEPDKKTEGSPLSLGITFGHTEYAPELLVTDEAGGRQDYRFAGNRRFIPAWRSGCVVCLQSCPGGKIGNHTYSIRDLVKGAAKFSLREDDLPFSAGDEVTIRLRLRE